MVRGFCETVALSEATVCSRFIWMRRDETKFVWLAVLDLPFCFFIFLRPCGLRWNCLFCTQKSLAYVSLCRTDCPSIWILFCWKLVLLEIIMKHYLRLRKNLGCISRKINLIWRSMRPAISFPCSAWPQASSEISHRNCKLANCPPRRLEAVSGDKTKKWWAKSKPARVKK